MQSYRVRLLETRISKDDTDDVALFNISRGDGQTCRIATFLTPLFRTLYMDYQSPAKERRDMVAGLGAQAIVERLQRGWEPGEEEFIVFDTDYPGAPGEPLLLQSCQQVTVFPSGTQPS